MSWSSMSEYNYACNNTIHYYYYYRDELCHEQSLGMYVTVGSNHSGFIIVFLNKTTDEVWTTRMFWMLWPAKG